MSRPEGIDISEHNGSVDFKRAARAVDFCIIRATYGLSNPDGMFTKQRVDEAEAAFKGPDKFVAYYEYGYPDPGDAVKECDHFIDTLVSRGTAPRLTKFKGVEVPTSWIDYEEYISNGKDPNWIRHWLSHHKKRTGVPAGLYGGNVLREVLADQDFGVPLWLPAYVQDYKPFVPVGWKDTGPLIWQNTERWQCPGVNGLVDHNFWIGGHE